MKKKKEQEKNDIERKLNTITEYDHLKKEIHDTKIGISSISSEIFLIVCLFLSCGIQEVIILTAMFSLGATVIFCQKDFLS